MAKRRFGPIPAARTRSKKRERFRRRAAVVYFKTANMRRDILPVIAAGMAEAGTTMAIHIGRRHFISALGGTAVAWPSLRLWNKAA